MKSKTFYPLAFTGYGPACVLALSLLVSCGHRHRSFTESDRKVVKDSVVRLLADVARDVSTRGPAAWLDYFDDSPGFFMAVNGSLAFREYPAATKFILDTVVKNMPGIALRWSGVEVDPLSRRIAAIGAEYQETVTMADKKAISAEGFFTATACLTQQGWKLHNLHWSTKQPVK